MELSRISLYPAVSGAEGAYFRGGRLSDGVLLLHAGETADFATYFSAFDAQLFLEKTTVRNVTLRLFFDGHAKVTLTRYIPSDESPKRGEKAYIRYDISHDDGENGYRTRTETYGGGIIAFSVTAVSDVTFYGGEWSCDDSCITCDPRLGIVVPVHEYTDGVKESAVHYARLCGEVYGLDVYVSDCSGTLDRENFPGLTVLPCAGAGDVGGVVRGLLECMDCDKTHFLIMSGFSAFDANVIRRLVGFLSVAASEFAGCCVGGALMSEKAPTEILECGARMEKLRIKNLKRGVDTTRVGGLLWARTEAGANFSAWHFYCAPVPILKSEGYPLPLCFGGAPEFGARLTAETPLLFPLGMGVWCAGVKEKEKWRSYYDFRNMLISHAVHGMTTGRRARSKLRRKFFRYILHAKIKLNYVFDAADDYLRGPDYIASLPVSETHERIVKSPRKKRGKVRSVIKALALNIRFCRSSGLNKKYAANKKRLAGEADWRIRVGMINIEEK